MFLEEKTYLDYNATSPMMPGVKEVLWSLLDLPLNASALHAWGQQAKRLVTQAHRKIGAHIEAHPDRIFITSGGTEANNWVLKAQPWNHVFISATSHDSIYNASENFVEVPVDSQGLLDLGSLEKIWRSSSQDLSCSLLSFVHAHNESGVIQPTEDLVNLAKRYGIFVHADVTQSLGKIPFSFTKMNVDFATLSAHKVGGPQGAGALVVKDPSLLTPFLKGGGQERGYRSGTENVLSIVGFSEALDLFPKDHMVELRKWHQEMEEDLSSFTHRHNHPLYIYGKEEERLPNTTCLSMPFVESATQVMRFDLDNISVSMGAACSSGRIQVSRSLSRMGTNNSLAQSAIRVSSGWATQEKDLQKFANIWKKIYLELKETAA